MSFEVTALPQEMMDKLRCGHRHVSVEAAVRCAVSLNVGWGYCIRDRKTKKSVLAINPGESWSDKLPAVTP
jgi:hypothetical protein